MLALISRRLLAPEGLRPGAVLVRDGVMEAVTSVDKIPAGYERLDVGDNAVLPGLVDSHVHINEPGRTEWEGFETATQAAASGGVTTLLDMPLNSIPVTTTVSAFETKLACAKERLWVDCGFWGGIVPGNAKDIEGLIDAGVAGFKIFLIHSGLAEFPEVNETHLREAMPILARRGVPLLVHAELCGQGKPPPISSDYASYVASRPKAWENEAIRLMIRLCRETKCRVHIVHLSSSEALAELKRAKQEGLPITAETCPHYLCFSAENIPEGRTEFKCAPPIRESENRERLWTALEEGVIDFIVSDHSPCSPDKKCLDSGDFGQAWGGISSLQLGLPAIWTEARRRGYSLADVSRWMSLGPALFSGLKNKGELAAGRDADLVVFDPDQTFIVKPEAIRHRHKLTPYAGLALSGVVKTTFLRGQKIYDEGIFAGPFGRTLLQRELHKTT